jgi:hypothetical protein
MQAAAASATGDTQILHEENASAERFSCDFDSLTTVREAKSGAIGEYA